jgi:hypothetical protein
MPSPSLFLPLCICWLSAYVGGFNRVAILLDHLSSRPNSRRNFRCIWQLFNAGRSTPQADIRKTNCLPLVQRTLYSWSQAIEVPEPPEICALPSFPCTPPIMAFVASAAKTQPPSCSLRDEFNAQHTVGQDAQLLFRVKEGSSSATPETF